MLKDRMHKAIRESINVDRPIMRGYEPEQIQPRTEPLKLVKKEDKPQRIKSINPGCQYAKYARFIVGKQMKAESTRDNTTTGWYYFVHDKDRLPLNKAAGWTENKRLYLLERPEIC